MIGLVLYNMFLFVSIRERKYLYYILFLFSTIFFMLSYNGIGTQFFWGTDSLLHNRLIGCGMSVLSFFAILFSSSFLELKERTPRLY